MHVYERRGSRVLADGYVHPELTGRGAGARLLEAAEQRALELAAEVPVDEAVSIETAHLVGDPRAPELLAGRGYGRVRTFFRMVADLTGAIPAPIWPPGLELRPFDLERDGRKVHAAVEEAFEHEWGHEARDYEAWAKRAVGVEQFDPELFVVVWDGDDVAAVSLDYAKRMGDWGWIATLAVRPAWRRRGLGLALLHEGFRRLAGRGETIAALGVDSENPTGRDAPVRARGDADLLARRRLAQGGEAGCLSSSCRPLPTRAGSQRSSTLARSRSGERRRSPPTGSPAGSRCRRSTRRPTCGSR